MKPSDLGRASSRKPLAFAVPESGETTRAVVVSTPGRAVGVRCPELLVQLTLQFRQQLPRKP